MVQFTLLMARARLRLGLLTIIIIDAIGGLVELPGLIFHGRILVL